MDAILPVALILLLLFGKGSKKEDPAILNVNPFKPDPPDPGQPPTPKGPGGFQPEAPDEPPPADLPDVNDWTDPYPTPGRFYQVKQGDNLSSIARKALLSAGYIAAKEIGELDDAEAQSFAQKVASSGSRRIKYINIIQCSAWNDALYETYGFGDKAHESPNGRALRLIPQHANNRARLAAGKAPIRNIALGSPADKGKGNRIGVDPAYRQGFEFLWMPAIDLDQLWASDGDLVTPEGLTWDDGTPQTLPPPWAFQLAIEDVSGVTLTEFGCGLGEWDFS